MALDTKYRPRVYEDVLGQDATTAVLRQFVKEGKGFHQSYVFGGHHGSGKTTLGRVLARALLCESPVEGNPCDKCSSCTVLLEGGTHECFEELDAATKSKKEDLERITEELTYSTFSGRRRIYLFDESHRLSKQALDVLLKPMEDSVFGSEDKRLVCIFCTTDPGKMSTTIFSRCAPVFVIRQVPPEGIAERLARICSIEKIEFDLPSLVMISEITDCHIRDALKMVEGVSMLGGVSKENVIHYLQLGVNDLVLSLVENLGQDLKQAVYLAVRITSEISPSAAYERISELALCAYKASLGVGKIPSYWDAPRVQELSKRSTALLGISSRFSGPPHRPSSHTLLLDVAAVHYALVGGIAPDRMGGVSLNIEANLRAPAPTNQEIPRSDSSVEGMLDPQKISVPEISAVPLSSGTGSPPPKRTSAQEAPAHEVAGKNSAGIWIDTRAVAGSKSAPVDTTAISINPDAMDPRLFKELVLHHLKVLGNGRSGAGRTG